MTFIEKQRALGNHVYGVVINGHEGVIMHDISVRMWCWFCCYDEEIGDCWGAWDHEGNALKALAHHALRTPTPNQPRESFNDE